MIFDALEQLKQRTIVISIILMSIGFILMIWPERYTDWIISTLGYILLIAATLMVLDFIASKKTMKNYINLIIALVLAIFGLCVLLFLDDILILLGWFAGLIWVVTGCISMFNTLTYIRRTGRKGWWMMILLSACLICFGLLTILNPWWDSPHLLLQMIGAMLLGTSVIGLLRLIWIWPAKKKD